MGKILSYKVYFQKSCQNIVLIYIKLSQETKTSDNKNKYISADQLKCYTDKQNKYFSADQLKCYTDKQGLKFAWCEKQLKTCYTKFDNSKHK